MITTLITKGTRELREKAALDICEKLKIHPYDRQLFSPSTDTEKENNEEKFGIVLVRKIKQKAILKPAYSSQNALIIQEAQLLTLPAQQALLKLLEEPPEHTSIILTAETEDALLPTICSRSRVLHLDEGQEKEHTSDILLPQNMTIGEQLVLAEKIIKSGSTEWMKNCILSHREYLLTQIKNKKEPENIRENLHLVKLLQNAQQAFMLLTTTNTNPRLIVEHFLFSSK